MSPSPRPELVRPLSALKEAPADPAPRLVLADWLEEHGDCRSRKGLQALRLSAQRRGRAPDRGIDLAAHRVDVAPLPARRGVGPVPCPAAGSAPAASATPPRAVIRRPPRPAQAVARRSTAHTALLGGEFLLEFRRRIVYPEWLSGVYEVTQAEYEKVTGTNPSYFSATGGGEDRVKGLDTSNFPVETVSWEEAVRFCEKLSALPAEKRAGRVYRLPTEAEWEYACRAGDRTWKPFHFKTAVSSLSSREANFDGNFPYGGAAKGPYLKRTTKVGSYKANAFGLFDMHGNVWEWCSDWYDKDYYGKSPKKDPQVPKTGTARVVRGGSWLFGYGGHVCRAAHRRYEAFVPGYRSLYGFRVACSLPPAPHRATKRVAPGQSRPPHGACGRAVVRVQTDRPVSAQRRPNTKESRGGW